jgi:hypothetical protein
VEVASAPLRHGDKKQNQRSAFCECGVPNEEMSFEARDKAWGADQTETKLLETCMIVDTCKISTCARFFWGRIVDAKVRTGGQSS